MGTIVIAFPAMILFALKGLEILSAYFKTRPDDFIALPFLLFGLNLINPDSLVSRWEHQALVFMVYLALVVALRKRRGSLDDNGSRLGEPASP